jgi:hypothetical protein
VERADTCGFAGQGRTAEVQVRGIDAAAGEIMPKRCHASWVRDADSAAAAVQQDIAQLEVPVQLALQQRQQQQQLAGQEMQVGC